MNERIRLLFEQTALHRNDHTTEQRLYEVEKFYKLLVNDMMVHLAAHALSGSSAMDVFVQWTEMYEGKTIDRGTKTVPRDPGDYDF